MAAARPEPVAAPDDGSALASTLRELVTAGLDPAMGITSIGRVARLAPDELRRSLDDIYRSRYHDFVRYTTSRLGNRQDAEDVVNEAFVRVLRANPDLTAPKALAGYVRRAVENVANRTGSATSRDRRNQTPDESADLERVLRDTAAA